MSVFVCQHCGARVRFDEPIPREATCDQCGRDLRACLQCRHYDTNYNNACRETMADPVVDKDRRNFCEYFSFTHAAFSGRASESGRAADARAKLESLFGGGVKDAKSREDEARKKLEGLFRKPGTKPDANSAKDE